MKQQLINIFKSIFQATFIGFDWKFILRILVDTLKFFSLQLILFIPAYITSPLLIKTEFLAEFLIMFPFKWFTHPFQINFLVVCFLISLFVNIIEYERE